MRVDVLKPAELSLDQVAAWSALQTADRALESPFFRPEFTFAVAAVCHNVEIAVLEEDGLLGFFPYQRGPGNVAAPVGGKLSDYQGVIAHPKLNWAPRGLLRACRLSAWNFDHLLACQLPFAAFHRRQASSPYMDVLGGFDAYRASRARPQSDEVTQVLRHGRKAGREVGPVRLEYQANPRLLEPLLAWKREQYRKRGVIDVLAAAWTRDLLRQVLNHRTTELSGVLSALYFGDRLAALHLALRSHDVLHAWFPAYEVELARYSPGSLLLLELAKASPALGLRKIDLGKGSELYKTRFMSDATPLAEGFVECRPARGLFKAAAWRARNWVRESPLRAPMKAVADRLLPWYARYQSRGST
jgi:CelD/BcsL family acetyltransferase involved in cellulose biosynthesis